jgi:hypothetical protein
MLCIPRCGAVRGAARLVVLNNYHILKKPDGYPSVRLNAGNDNTTCIYLPVSFGTI